jgi:hypothetical protein
VIRISVLTAVEDVELLGEGALRVIDAASSVGAKRELFRGEVQARRRENQRATVVAGGNRDSG